MREEAEDVLTRREGGVVGCEDGGGFAGEDHPAYVLRYQEAYGR